MSEPAFLEGRQLRLWREKREDQFETIYFILNPNIKMSDFIHPNIIAILYTPKY